jgi:methionyl aminopeptidase
LWRVTNVEKRELERASSELIESVRLAAEVHRQVATCQVPTDTWKVRYYAQSLIKPGMVLTDFCEKIEDMNRRLVQENGLKQGIDEESAN